MLILNKTIAFRAYSKYLKDKGYSEESKNGNPSTVYDYTQRLERICKRENFISLDELGENISEIIKKYSPNGSEAEYGSQSHSSNIKALKLFYEFYNYFDEERNI